MTEVSTITEADQSATPCCKKEKIPTQKDVIDAWLGVVILNIILGALFPYAWWAWIPRIAVFVHAIEISIKYHDIKKTPPSSAIASVKTETPIATPVITETTTIATAHFCTNCGYKLNESAKFCPYCGNAL